MEEINKINLKEQFLKMYVKEATQEQLHCINSLLESGDYNQINKIIEDYTHNIVNNKNLKEFVENGGSDGTVGSTPTNPVNAEINNEDMDPQAFELYCILMLIDKYLNEEDKVKKQLLQDEIQIALKEYRTPEELSPAKSR